MRCTIRSFILWASTAAAVLLLGGCSLKEYKRTEPKLITLKTKQLRFNDVGFIRKEGDAVQAELFSAGQAVERFEINRLVCVTRGCLTKSAFNAEYLSPEYPDSLMQEVLLGVPIFEGEGMQRSGSCFEQKVKRAAFDIHYRVAPGEVYFKDRMNGILVKIRDLPEAKKENDAE